jgi:hypothetical protein
VCFVPAIHMSRRVLTLLEQVLGKREREERNERDSLLALSLMGLCAFRKLIPRVWKASGADNFVGQVQMCFLHFWFVCTMHLALSSSSFCVFLLNFVSQPARARRWTTLDHLLQVTGDASNTLSSGVDAAFGRAGTMFLWLQLSFSHS